MELLGEWEVGGDGGGPDAVILVPELPPAGMVENPPKRKGVRAELPELPPGLEPAEGYSRLLVRTALIRPESYAPGMRRPRVTCPLDAARLLRHLSYYDQEYVVVVALGSDGRVAAIHEAHIGTMSASYAQARHVLKVGILAAAAAVIVAHNHPSGDPTPSRQDGEMTGGLMAAGSILGVTVHDHLVVAQDGFASFADGVLSGWDGESLGRVPAEVVSAFHSELQALERWSRARASDVLQPWGVSSRRA